MTYTRCKNFLHVPEAANATSHMPGAEQ
jgi:hypothetical protein